MATDIQLLRAVRTLDALYERARFLQCAPRNRWESEWQAFKARAKALRIEPETDAQRDAVLALVMEAIAHFSDEVKRHRELSVNEACAVARWDRARAVLARRWPAA